MKSLYKKGRGRRRYKERVDVQLAVSHGAFLPHEHSRGVVVPELLTAIGRTVINTHTLVDIGASKGHYVQALLEAGYDIFGLDATPGIEEMTQGLVKQCDLVEDCSRWELCADWGLFFEVGEHIPEQHEQVVLDNVAAMPRIGLLTSWSSTKRGLRHVNPKSPVYIANEFGRRGWRLDPGRTEMLQKRLLKYRGLRRNVLAFLRCLA